MVYICSTVNQSRSYSGITIVCETSYPNIGSVKVNHEKVHDAQKKNNHVDIVRAAVVIDPQSRFIWKATTHMNG